MSSAALPTDSKARKDIPLVRGLLDYFPAAFAAVAELSRAGNEKHNPGEDLHWSRGKSNDHADCIVRHLVDRGTVDPEDGILHSTKVAWRALANLQEELEAAGAPLARGARVDPPPQDHTPLSDIEKRFLVYTSQDYNVPQARIDWLLDLPLEEREIVVQGWKRSGLGTTQQAAEFVLRDWGVETTFCGT